MDISVVVSIGSFMVSLIAIGTVVFRIGQMVERLNKLENTAVDVAKIQVKVDTVWDFQMRRAFAEAVNKGYGEMRSPLKIDSIYVDAMKSIVPDLHKWYSSIQVKPTDKEIALEIEKRWGKLLVENFCIPHGYEYGGCLAIALSVAKGKDELGMP